MFYIDKYTKLGRGDFTLMHIVPSLIVFVAFFAITIWSWLDLRNSIDIEHKQILSAKVVETEQATQDRLANYSDVLNAGVGLFGASDSVTRNEWKEFINVFDLPSRYPGIEGVGFSKIIAPAELQSHVDSIRAEGFSDYQIYPAGQRDIYTSLIYIEPLDTSNAKALGYDMYSEPLRHEAMDQSAASGQAAITGKLALIQDQDSSNTNPGVVMFVPVYENASELSNQQQRGQLLGYIYAQLWTNNLLKDIVNTNDPHFAFQIFDGQPSDNSLLYESPNFNSVNSNPDRQATIQKFKVNNKEWTISGSVSPEVISPRERNRPASTLWGGLLFSVFLAGFIYLLLLNRARALATKEDKEIQQAKDELLALASHQLRTPATGVKQYIGMLREGYGGKITARQRKFLDKAYNSNERQLRTINDMLFVARADTGNIDFNFYRFNLSALLEDVLEEKAGVIKERQHSLKTFLPKRSVYLEGDGRYLRMAIENIIGNANKYTPAGGQIKVKLTKVKTVVNVAVTDTGIGVKEKDYPKLFRKFSRVPNELTDQVIGSGIGLYLSKQIIEAHHGQIDFVSVKNQGSTCTITLPLKQAKNNQSL